MRKLIAANWKMHKTAPEAAETVNQLASLLNGHFPDGRDLLIFAPFTALEATAKALAALQTGLLKKEKPGLMAGAQNLYPEEEGAFTGEISVRMIRDCGAGWVLTGHSERRHILGETDDMVRRKTGFALAHGLRTIVCIGETLEERQADQLAEVLARQLRTGLDQAESLSPGSLADWLAVAYEPVWAIGTGRTAQESDIIQAHGLIRRLLEDMTGGRGHHLRLLYGGSVKPDNAGRILTLDNVDGLLVGGASLQAESFFRILTA